MANSNSEYANFFPAQRKTRLPGGYMGKILRVDMSTGDLTDLNLPEEPLLRKYWGGQLFAEYVLLNELPLDIDPYDAKNVIVGMTGPITGTGFTPGGTKICFVYLSPATQYTLGRGATSGYFGTSLKAAGYDGVIITGAARKPSLSLCRRRQSRAARCEPRLGQRHQGNRRDAARRIRPPRCADRLHRPRRRKPHSRGNAGQRL